MTKHVVLRELERAWSSFDLAGTQPGRLHTGIDVVDIEVIARQVAGDLGERFQRTVFSPQEIYDCRGRAEKFATRWAVKEAVAKAIGTGFRQGLRPGMIEIATTQIGSIEVQPFADSNWPNRADKWTWAVSASHDAGVAVAIAVAIPYEQAKGLAK